MDIFRAIEQNIRLFTKRKGITLSELISSIEMTEGGFYRMLTTGSMKIKTLEKISQELEAPIKNFFDTDEVPYEQAKTSQNTVAEPDYNYKRENEILNDTIRILTNTIDDKNKIIELLSNPKQ